MKSRLTLLFAAGLLLAGTAGAADWPQWRGPNRNAISQETGLLKQWPADGPRLLWQINTLGNGFSTPSIVGDRIYLQSNRGLQNELLHALNAADGSLAWETRLGAVGNPNQMPNYPGARSTPTVDGDVIYALGSDGDLVCVNRANGEERWRKSLRNDFGGAPGRWAYAESPLVDGDAVIVTPGGTQASLLKLNKRTGAEIWRCVVPGGEEAAYASVIVAELGGVRQYVQMLARGVVGVDAATGRFLWRDDRAVGRSQANIPTPVAHDNAVYAATGQGGGALVKLTAAGGAVTAAPGYADRGLPNGIGGFVRLGDLLYGTAGPAMTCVEFATGQVRWSERGIGAAAVCYADGLFFLHGEDTGLVALVEATPEAYREKGRFSPPNLPDRPQGAKAWAHPVVANGRLYLRDINMLWCYDVQAP